MDKYGYREKCFFFTNRSKYKVAANELKFDRRNYSVRPATMRIEKVFKNWYALRKLCR